MNSEHHFPYFTPRINSDRKNILSSKSSQGVVKYRILIKRRYYTWAKVNKIVLISKHFGTFLFRKTPPPENVVLDNQWFMFLCFPHLSRIYGFEKQESFTTVHRWNFWGGMRDPRFRVVSLDSGSPSVTRSVYSVFFRRGLRICCVECRIVAGSCFERAFGGEIGSVLVILS